MTEAASAAERAARLHYGRLLAFLAARTRDVAAAEDALGDAFASALKAWPQTGIPDHPEAWLLTVARRRLTDQARRTRTRTDATEAILLQADERQAAGSGAFPDERLGLLFACAHPAIDQGVRTPLMLQTVLGVDAQRIASAFLVAPATMGQRLSRAKAKLRDAGIPFRLPEPEEWPSRLNAVLSAIYAGFTLGDDAGAIEAPLAAEARYLALLVAELVSDQPEALGLASLVLHVSARRPARRGESGAFVPLAQQDCRLWDRGSLELAEGLLRRAAASGQPGRFQIEAAIQSVHAARALTGETDWQALHDLYGVLHAWTGSFVVALNRAVVLAELAGPEPALNELLALAEVPGLATYQPYWAARGTIAARAGRVPEAREALERAIILALDPAVQRHLAEIRQRL